MHPTLLVQRTTALIALVLGVIALAHAQTPQPSQSVFQRMKSAIPAAALGAATPSRKHGEDDRGLRSAHGFIGDTNAGPFTTIDAPRAGLLTAAFGIENDGRTVGAYVDTDGRLHGFLRTADTFRTIDVPGAAATFAARINARGQIVGGYSRQRLLPALEMSHGFLLEDGRFTSIDVPGAVRTQAFGINNNGQIVGEYVDARGKTHGFLLDGDEFTTLEAPGATATFAYDIDDNGRVLGFSFDGAAFHGFLRDAQGTFTAIDMPGAEERGTLTFGFNNRDQIVGIGLVLADAQLTTQAFVLENGRFTPITAPETGVAFDVSDQGQFAGVYDFMGHGFLRDRHGEFTTIDPPEGNINEIIGINNRGQIVGRYVDAQSRARGFLKDKRGFRPIDVPGATATSTFQINDRGQVVGNYSTTANNTTYPTRGFMFEDGVFTLIDVPGSQHTSPVSIDNLGRIVGEYQDAAGAFHGFVRDPDGSFTTVDAPQATGGTALTAINDRGQILGGYVDAGGAIHIFQLEDGKFTPIDPPRGAVAFQPFAINNQGDIVGLAFDGVRIRGFLLRDGRFTRITPPGAFVPWLIGTFATDIDERGRIAGTSL
jgi:probable HAF family extracellular repeat protein